MTLSYEVKQGDIHDRLKSCCHSIQSATTSIQDSFTSKDPAQQRACAKPWPRLPAPQEKGREGSRRQKDSLYPREISGVILVKKWLSWTSKVTFKLSSFLEAFFCFVGLFFLKRSVIWCAHVCSCACRGSVTLCPFPGNRVSHWTKILCWPPAGDWAWTLNPPVSTSRVLGLQACLTTPST